MIEQLSSNEKISLDEWQTCWICVVVVHLSSIHVLTHSILFGSREAYLCTQPWDFRQDFRSRRSHASIKKVLGISEKHHRRYLGMIIINLKCQKANHIIIIAKRSKTCI